MKKSWWRSDTELDDDQRKFILLPERGRYALVGPPGSGKTNLLLLRAQFLAGTGASNVLVVTYTATLADFIRSGISKGPLTRDQVMTYHSWANRHVQEFLNIQVVKKGSEFDEDTRADLLEKLEIAHKKPNSRRLYDAILVDEAQDLTRREVELLCTLSSNVCVCGDSRQSVYNRDGLEAIETLNLRKHVLKHHFRIGPAIARAADRLMPVAEGDKSLESLANYPEKDLGKSRALIRDFPDRARQFDAMVETLEIQLSAYKDESIGILCGLNATLEELQSRLEGSPLADRFCVPRTEKEGFLSSKPIKLMTIHSSKGAEFRAVHVFGAEDLRNYPLNARSVSYTAITRAKTSLDVYVSGVTNKPLESALRERKEIALQDLFDDDGES
jgi:superfamily I DNA/RNA helicase